MRYRVDKNKYDNYYVGDFETTVYKGQERTDVWASALVPLYSEDVVIHGSIDDAWEYIVNLPHFPIIYYHNLKFDFSFWIDFFLKCMGFKPALSEDGRFVKKQDMPNNTFIALIGKMNNYYSATIKYKGKYIEFRDSAKLLPYSVEQMGKGFKTKHRKKDIQYKGFRYPNCPRTEEEDSYIANDVLVVKECIEHMFNNGNDKLTIGSCCIYKFKETSEVGRKVLDEKLLPDLYKEELITCRGETITQGLFSEWSYKGGWCYNNPNLQGKVLQNGVTIDVNSLYPSMMHSSSGNVFPVGKGEYFEGNNIPDTNGKGWNNKTYIVRFECRFAIKYGYLPTVQIKRNALYKSNEWLTTSDVNYKGNKTRYYVDKEGNKQDSRVTLTMTQMDYEMFLLHYNVFDLVIVDGLSFHTMDGLYDYYIDYFMKQKKTSEGAAREEAKLFLNNLYGKLATKPDSSFRVPMLKEGGEVYLELHEEAEKAGGYMPAGTFTTSHSRCFDISVAQANYIPDSHDSGFAYSDTDSNHISLPNVDLGRCFKQDARGNYILDEKGKKIVNCDYVESIIHGVKIDDGELSCWKLELVWDTAIFLRQKAYIEISSGYRDIKCCGMTDRVKRNLGWYFDGYYPTKDEIDKFEINETELVYLKKYSENPLALEDFKPPLKIAGSLKQKRINGGVILEDGIFTLSENVGMLRR